MFADDITAFMNGRNKELMDMAQKVLKQVKTEVEKRACVIGSAVVTGIMEPTMAELANMPTVSDIASWCDF